jgi:hypothetical protein
MVSGPAAGPTRGLRLDLTDAAFQRQEAEMRIYVRI